MPFFIGALQVVFAKEHSVFFMSHVSPLIIVLISCYYLMLFVLGVCWLVKQIRVLSELKNERIKSELIFLSTQINPHFFFNVLNSLYGTILSDAAKAQNLVLKLSDLMRYSIYKGTSDSVSIKDELAYLTDYIELQKMRYHREVDIRMDTHIVYDHFLPPLLFIILLENAFKHGIEDLLDKAYVHINISSSKNEVRFKVENNFNESVRDKKNTGIGLANLNRRLELLFPGRFALVTTEKMGVYQSELTLNI